MEILGIYIVLSIALLECARAGNVYNVLNFGAVGNGIADDSRAFLKAWGSTCGDVGPNPTLVIPGGKTFLLKPMTTFRGPCKAPALVIQVMGNLVAPNTIRGWHGASNWLAFHGINGLHIVGNGRIGGQGIVWWAQSCHLHPWKECAVPPTALVLNGCNDLHLSGVTLFNNPRNHISIESCTGVYVSNVVITAPASSPNTDGIDISNSQYINIWDSTIATGDDCIAINSGTSNVKISSVQCGPGHGISIGSLGEDGKFAAVEQIHVFNCTFNGAMNGARIKTWQGGSGYARGITFKEMHMTDVKNPIIIDQYYCGDHTCNGETSSVAVSDVRFVGFRGTSSKELAVMLDCSRTVGCTSIVVNDIQLAPSVPGMKLSSSCINAHGPPCPSCAPQVTCLS